MSESLVFRKSLKQPDAYNLVIRRHDLSGVEYEHICTVSTETAVEMNRLAERGIGFLHSHPYQWGTSNAE
nr:hypothetical protein [Brucella intermedia]